MTADADKGLQIQGRATQTWLLSSLEQHDLDCSERKGELPEAYHLIVISAGLTCGGQASKVRLIWGLPPRLPVRLLMPEWPQGVSVMARGLPPARESAPMWLWGEHLQSRNYDGQGLCGHKRRAKQKGQVLSTLRSGNLPHGHFWCLQRGAGCTARDCPAGLGVAQLHHSKVRVPGMLPA